MLTPRRAIGLVTLAVTLTAGRPAAASPSDSDDDDSDALPAAKPRGTARASAGAAAATNTTTKAKPKAVAFDPAWLTPFFQGKELHKAAADFRQESWGNADYELTKAARKLPPGSEERLAARFLAAQARANQSKWAEAAALFEGLYRDYPRLGPYHAYHAARCRLREGQAQAALEWAGKVEEGTVPEAEAELVRIDALRALSRWKDVTEAAAAFLARFPNGPRRAEAMFKQAEAMEKVAAETKALEIDADLPDITALYRRVWAEAPLEDWSDRAAKRLDAIAAALPPSEARLVRTHIAAEWFARGVVYFDRNRNTESEAAFGSTLSAVAVTPDLECRARYHRAQSVWKQRQRTRAAPMFDDAEAACARAGNADLHAKSLYQGARSWAAAGDRAAAEARYARVEVEHPDHSYADDARLRTAELASEAGDEPTANKVLAEIPGKYPRADLLGEALWRLAFSAWRGERFDEALHWLDENLQRIPHEDIWYAEGRALYWKARVLERRKEVKTAREFYRRAVREYPLSVYALLSLARLADGDARGREALLRELRKDERPANLHFAPRPLFGEAGFRRAIELARMGQGSDARRELAHLGLSTSGEKHGSGGHREDEDLLWITALVLDRAGLWSAAHSIPRYTIPDYKNSYPHGVGTTKWRVSYPRAFPELVARNAKANQIPESLQWAIMREESAFSPRIESFANAIGLTQMLIKTARRFSNGQTVTREVLQNPVKNLEYGSRFLGFLWAHFAKAAPLAIAGYNAGEGAVDKWLAERGQLAMDEFMETIPYDETRNYTKRVLASYFAYSWLYDDKRPVPPIPLPARPNGNGK